tara:strand:- start:127 stop:825 length:699 start_codon:yes stop_codon:yes gene_type:complete
MATINVNPTQDGYLLGVGSTSFTTARGSAINAIANPSTAYTNALSAQFRKYPGRGGYTYFFNRAAFGFNVTAYSSDTITNVSLRLTTTTSTTADTFYAVPFTGFGATLGTALTTADWSKYTSIGSSNYGSTTFSSTAGIQSITLSGTAVTDMFATGYVKIGILGAVDYGGDDPAATEVSDFLYLNFGSASNMQLQFDQSGGGYGNIINGIEASEISKVSGIAIADISKVTGV